MLVPSFSSKGFPKVRELWDISKDNLIDTALVSSYDIYYDYFEPSIDGPQVLFVDSGGYEATKDHDLSDIYGKEYRPKEWSSAQHRDTLQRIETSASLVLISLDTEENNIKLDSQVRNAESIFSQYPDAVTNFLVKPYDSPYLDMDYLERNVEVLGEFEIIGVTEKELGRSQIERLVNTVRLRQALSQSGHDTPIHVFGCLDPISVWLFYLCGADIFDGLSWLRFAYHDFVPIYRNTWAALEGYSQMTDAQLWGLSITHNLRVIKSQQIEMARYGDPSQTPKVTPSIELLQTILDEAGVAFEKP